MSLSPPDPTLYVRAPMMTAESGIALSRAVVAACSKDFPASIKKSAKKITEAADHAQAALAFRQKAVGKVSESDARLVDQLGDASWGALRMRLLGYGELPAAKFPDAQRALELVQELFGPDGLSFLKETYPVQWSTADTILKRIDDDNLHIDIDRIAGKEFLVNIRAQHKAYGAMVQSLLLREKSAGVNLAEHVRAMGRAIVDYATRVCGSVDEDDNEQAIAAVLAALRPLDAYREATARRAAGTSADEPTPADPIATEPAGIG
jgi:hypothetical protein